MGARSRRRLAAGSAGTAPAASAPLPLAARLLAAHARAAHALAARALAGCASRRHGRAGAPPACAPVRAAVLAACGLVGVAALPASVRAQPVERPPRAAPAPRPARILVLGDSHTASDLFTGAMRRDLQARFGDAGAGLVFPARPWPSYRRDEVVVRGEGWTPLRVTARERRVDHYGLAGVALECAPETICTAELEPRDPAPGAVADAAAAAPAPVGLALVGASPPDAAPAQDAELWLLARPDGGTLDVALDDVLLATVSTRADAAAPLYVPLALPPGSFRLRLATRGDGAVRVFGVVLERGRSGGGVVVDALGINGARARDQLAWDDALLRAHLARRDPDLVVLAYGTNESGDDQPLDRYAADLRRVVARLRDAAPRAACLLVGPTDRPERVRRVGWVPRARQEQINEAQRAIARDLGCAFFDTVAFQGGPLATVAWARAEPPLASRDHVHLTRLGYERLGAALVEAILADERLSAGVVAAARGDVPGSRIAATAAPRPAL
jgi:lysophospholipase L1-like esterase